MQTYVAILVAAALLLWLFLFMAIWVSRYVKVPPNQVLVVSGRKIQRPDGSFVGFRIVKGGGTFVWPIVERADSISLEVLTIEMPGLKARTNNGAAVEADCASQIKIDSDDRAIGAAIEHFLSKKPEEIKNVIRPVLEKNLNQVLAASNIQDLSQNPGACAAKAQAAASEDLRKMGVNVISLTIRNARSV
jgi:flotillin